MKRNSTLTSTNLERNNISEQAVMWRSGSGLSVFLLLARWSRRRDTGGVLLQVQSWDQSFWKDSGSSHPLNDEFCLEIATMHCATILDLFSGTEDVGPCKRRGYKTRYLEHSTLGAVPGLKKAFSRIFCQGFEGSFGSGAEGFASVRPRLCAAAARGPASVHPFMNPLHGL